MDNGVKNGQNSDLDKKAQDALPATVNAMEPVTTDSSASLSKAEDAEAKKQASLERLRKLKDLLEKEDDEDDSVSFDLPEHEVIRNGSWRWE